MPCSHLCPDSVYIIFRAASDSYDRIQWLRGECWRLPVTLGSSSSSIRNQQWDFWKHPGQPLYTWCDIWKVRTIIIGPTDGVVLSMKCRQELIPRMLAIDSYKGTSSPLWPRPSSISSSNPTRGLDCWLCRM